MKKFAVAYAEFGDTNLKIRIVEALGWRSATVKVLPIMDSIHGRDLEDFKREVLRMVDRFDIVEII